MPGTKRQTIIGRHWQFGWCEFDEISRALTVNSKPVKLESKPLDVLTILLERPTETIGKEELLEAIWGNTSEQSLAVAVSKLRRAFGGERDAIILNLAGVGYRMAVSVACTVGSRPGPPAFQPEPGQSVPNLPDWMIAERLGQDNVSPVWLANHLQSGERRVFKFATDGVHLRALQREATVSRLLERTPGETAKRFVRILDRNFNTSPYYVGMEYAGIDLREWSASADFAAMELPERIRLAALIADGVAAAHALGILHNDLKPGNILIMTGEATQWPLHGGRGSKQASPRYEVRIADFGVASLPDAQRLRNMDITDYGVQGDEQSSTPVGTVMYRAPELHSGNAPTALADVYSLGVLLFQIAIGDFTLQLSPGWEERIPDPILREDIAAAAHVDPAHRLRSAADLASRLHRINLRRETRIELEVERERSRHAEWLLERTRLRRPWVISLFAVLAVGLLGSWSLYRNAVASRNVSEARRASLEKMYAFVARDLLGQSNPYLNVPGANIPGQTLLEAIRTALPNIDRRFAGQPEIAARLHVTIADAFRTRAQFADADAQYMAASLKFHEAGQELSPEAMEAELKRDDALMVSVAPGAFAKAQESFARQSPLIAKLPRSEVEVHAWAALVNASLIGLGPKPADALPILQDAIRLSEATPGLDPLLVITLKKRVCGIYLRMGDGANLERTARELIQDFSTTYGPESPNLAPVRMYIQEALYLQRRYKDAALQGDSNFLWFSRVLGPQHELTLGALANRAADEGQLGLYEAAATDDLKVYRAELSSASPSPRFLLGSLADAAMFECHAGHFQEGLEHARQVVRNTESGPTAMPVFAAQARFIVAECEVAEAETGRVRADETSLGEADALLRKIATSTPDDPLREAPNLPANVQIARARLSLLRHDKASAHQLAAIAAPTFRAPDADPYEKAALTRVERAIAAGR